MAKFYLTDELLGVDPGDGLTGVVRYKAKMGVKDAGLVVDDASTSKPLQGSIDDASAVDIWWYSDLLEGAYVLEARFNLWMAESASQANAFAYARWATMDANGGNIVTHATGSMATELPTTRAAQNWNLGRVSDAAVPDPFRFRFFIGFSGSSVGTGRLVNLGYGGVTDAADGDSYVSISVKDLTNLNGSDPSSPDGPKRRDARQAVNRASTS